MTDLRSMYPDDVPASAPASAPHAGQSDRQPDRTERVLYPEEHSTGATQPQRPEKRAAASDEEPAALSYEDSASFDDTTAKSFFNQAALAALQEDDRERSAELDQAGKALVADMKDAGTPSSVFNEALAAYNESASDGFTQEQRDEMAEATMKELQASYGSTFESDLNAARALIADLDKLTPGLIDSLEATNAGNSPRLIKAAIAEAKRRGYGR
ncbi:hypothetical protein LY56_02914 [Roseinatronobacter thiooxidans]|uniref:Uncharacterized protein n=1 Tax=Roseinatronobacter thiooxidans TaxID=121821 RepID=A0A2W7PT13_9RHOB|nr:hypothetical protein [Roseinatronobacter thiooxidans]PZX39381.1 hypothetical protein LY56_02914 [Roseinatronobacter thiooxidans]